MKSCRLKDEIGVILNSARPLEGQTNMYITEKVNEHGLKCTYRFSEDAKEVLQGRTRQQKKSPSKYKGWEYIQKRLSFLERHKEVIQTLFDINYLLNAHNYDTQKACQILFRDKKVLPSGFRKEYSRYTGCSDYIVTADNSRYTIDSLISLLPTLPKAWLKEVER